jgi:hypothetical protein
MKSMLKEEWMMHPQLKKWSSRSCVDKNLCSCKSEKNHVELFEHDSCVRGRIDTTVCTKCESIVKIKIIR